MIQPTINIEPTDAERELILRYANADVRQIAFKLRPSDNVRPQYVLQQIAGQAAIRSKVPSWRRYSNLIFPVHLSVEQCSSEATARYKAKLVERLKGREKTGQLVDLTGGFGVDFSFMSEHFEQSTYIELNAELSQIVKHNINAIGVSNAKVVATDGVVFLHELTSKVSCLFIDPARRSQSGAKTVLLSDCTPDLTQLEEQMVSKADFAIAKLSPMLDVSAALSELHHVAEVHAVAVGNECKELLIVMQTNAPCEPTIFAAADERIFSFTLSEEKNAPSHLTNSIERYLYEPSASVLKVGAFKTIAARFELKKLHQSSHLYTSNTLHNNFPGRLFEVLSVGTLHTLPPTMQGVKKANIATRNFPLRPEEIRKRLKLSDGGADYIFGTTLSDNKKAIIHCKKL